MAVTLENHPCFNEKARHESARIHLPVAPRCNVQCNFCNRQFDCVNESRPGVTSSVLTPRQSVEYLKSMVAKTPNLNVMGIAGPGDPFANPEETLETLRLVRAEFPDLILCLATNGLNLVPYLDQLAELDVSHVTITVNGVEPAIIEKVYGWLRYGNRVHKGLEAATHLWEQQQLGIVGLKERGIIVKINSILIPGVNEDHIREVARVCASLGADVFNVMPLIPNPGTAFGHLTEPSAELTRTVRAQAGLYLKQMAHCSRCRADAVGLIGHENTAETHAALKSFEQLSFAPEPTKELVAVASMEGALVNLHLGQAAEFLIYRLSDLKFVEERRAPKTGQGDERWNSLAALLGDCQAAFVSGAGARPQEVLAASGIEVFTVEGVISEVLESYRSGADMGLLLKRQANACNAGCRGDSVGCG